MFTTRFNYFIAFILLAFILGYAAYLEIYANVTPCNLCILQRVVMGLLALIFLLGVGLGSIPVARILLGVTGAITSLLGIALAGRQVWLQHIPNPQGANCEVSLRYMLDVLPLEQVIKNVFIGGVECARISWEFLHLSLAQWSLIAFIVFFIFSLWQLRR